MVISESVRYNRRDLLKTLGGGVAILGLACERVCHSVAFPETPASLRQISFTTGAAI